MKHRNGKLAGRFRTLLLALSFVLVIPLSAAYAEEGSLEKAADSTAQDSDQKSAASVTVIRANGDVVTPMGAGEWDYLGARSTSSKENPSNYVHSGGGDFKFRVSYGPSGGAWYQLREYDPGSNRDDIVADKNGYSLFYLYPGDTLIYRGIGGFVDGDNKKAEFYVYESFSGSATVQYWD